MKRLMMWFFGRFTAFDPGLIEWARQQESAANRATQRQERQPRNTVERTILGTRRREEERR